MALTEEWGWSKFMAFSVVKVLAISLDVEGGLVKARDQCSPGATPISLGRDLIFDICIRRVAKGTGIP